MDRSDLDAHGARECRANQRRPVPGQHGDHEPAGLEGAEVDVSVDDPGQAVDASNYSRALTAQHCSRPTAVRARLQCDRRLSLQSCRELHLPDQRVRQGLGLEHVACRLNLEQPRVNLAETHQVVVRPLFCHDPILEHANPVRLPHR